MAQASETAPHSTYYNEFDGTFPDLNKTIDIIEWILTEYGRGGGAKLNRVHFHCLNYHIIAETTSSSSSRSSYNTRSSLLSGAKVASKQACGVEFDDESDDERLENLLDLKWLAEDQERSVWLRVDSNDDNDNDNKRVEEFEFDASNPVIEFVRARHGIRFYLTPVLVCRDPVKTVGLGDAISASGLFYSFS